MINVTKTYLPPLPEYVSQLERIWASGNITNNGPLVRELEAELKTYLGVRHLFFTANGTLGLQIALRSLEITGKVVTTPFSYVATIGSLLWEKCTPVFADINPDDLCIDPEKVEAAVDKDTQAILAVHVYGHACNVKALEGIAKRRGLKIIYDAAHAFGSALNGRALASYGDVSVLSFHATKLFHTVEGGAVITSNDELARRIRLQRAFGHIGEEHFTLGINAKNSELHAAMGLCILPRVNDFISHRRELYRRYDSLLAGLPLRLPRPEQSGFEYNHAYYPVLFPSEAALLAARSLLMAHDIVPRRYFHPALNRLPYCQGEPCPAAESVAAQVLCLPMSLEITPEIQQKISRLLRECLAP